MSRRKKKSWRSWNPPQQPHKTAKTNLRPKRPCRQQWANAIILLLLSLSLLVLLAIHLLTNAPYFSEKLLAYFPYRSSHQASTQFGVGFFHGMAMVPTLVGLGAIGIRVHAWLFPECDNCSADFLATVSLILIFPLLWLVVMFEIVMPVLDLLRAALGGVVLDWRTRTSRGKGGTPYSNGSFFGVMLGFGCLFVWASIKNEQGRHPTKAKMPSSKSRRKR